MRTLSGLILSISLALTGCYNYQQWLTKPAPETSGRPAEHVNSDNIHYRLGLRYINKGEYAKALPALTRAAEAGHQDAQYLLGELHASGLIGPADLDLARTWWLRAAHQGSPRALQALGDMYLNGRGTAVETAWALRWYTQAALQGHAPAQYSLGVAHARGMGVMQDSDDSVFWLHLAERRGAKEATPLLQRINAQLDQQTRADINARASAWRPLPPQRAGRRARLRFVQFSLNRLGYPAGPVDGLSGPQTRQAILAYQAAEQGLPSDGRLSDALLVSLRRRLGD
ncbi:SEL1-like repeat protein [Marinobacterium arenosum]|uniref:SEL1-like repeat protein n=1 Tax=Marinobacterium arenosum TaxID=2862496 RepID=UPI001C95AAD9|nr:SEL1-like repeat protein [Marinobacterium arenosum]MBY4677120.1 SEL1-like repeat protein [Marinobacterium arenosum]